MAVAVVVVSAVRTVPSVDDFRVVEDPSCAGWPVRLDKPRYRSGTRFPNSSLRMDAPRMDLSEISELTVCPGITTTSRIPGEAIPVNLCGQLIMARFEILESESCHLRR